MGLWGYGDFQCINEYSSSRSSSASSCEGVVLYLSIYLSVSYRRTCLAPAT